MRVNNFQPISLFIVIIYLLLRGQGPASIPHTFILNKKKVPAAERFMRGRPGGFEFLLDAMIEEPWT